MKKIISLLLAVLMICLFCSPAFAKNSAGDYEKALALLADQKYQEAVKAFDALGSYQDAPRYTMYCKAQLAAQNGDYAQAVDNFSSLGAFQDSGLLAVYYTAMACETMMDYETAASLLEPISLYKDSSERLLSYPEKINARDYQRAVAAQEGNQLDTALSLFKKLGNYKDSPDRLKAVEAAIAERDAAALEKANAEKYAQAEALEAAGDFAAAYDLFVALGNYQDAAARAESVKQKAQYQKGILAIGNGDYKGALSIFTALGDYEDAKEKAYALGICQFASMEKKNDTSAAFRFHSAYGLINFASNHVTAPQFDSIAILSDACYKIKQKDGYGLMDADGNVLAAPQWYDISYPVEQALVAVRQTVNNDGWWTTYGYTFSLLGEDGKILTGEYTAMGQNASNENSYYSVQAPAFPDGLMRVQTAQKKWGFIDAGGNEKIAPQFQDARDFSGGLAAVKQDGYWGYIGPDGQFLIPPRFLSALDFNESGRAEVESQAGWHVIDKMGELVYFTSQPMAEPPQKEAAAAAADADDVELLAREIVMLEMGETTENAEEEYPELYFFAKEVLASSNNDLEEARNNLYTYLYRE